MVAPIRMAVRSQSAVAEARRQARQFMVALGATVIERETVVLAVSELARTWCDTHATAR